MSDREKVYVYSATNRIGTVESLTSLQWLSLYNSAGEVKLVCAPTEFNISALVNQNVIYVDGQPQAAVIVDVEKNGNKMTVRAFETTRRWEKRVLMGTLNINNIEKAMLEMCVKNRRGLKGVTAGTKGYTETAQTQKSWGSVFAALTELSQEYWLGFRENFDQTTTQMTFEVYKGTDRTNINNSNYVGYFGDDVKNLYGTSVRESIAEHRNVAVVAGAGEGENRVVEIVSITHIDDNNREEIFVDARDVTKTYQTATPTGEYDENGNPIFTYETHTYTDSEYRALLKARGIEELIKNIPVFEVSANTTDTLMVFGKDYFLGDTMPFISRKFNLRFSARIEGVKTIIENNSRKEVLQFSDTKILEEYKA